MNNQYIDGKKADELLKLFANDYPGVVEKIVKHCKHNEITTEYFVNYMDSLDSVKTANHNGQTNIGELICLFAKWYHARVRQDLPPEILYS